MIIALLILVFNHMIPWRTDRNYFFFSQLTKCLGRNTLLIHSSRSYHVSEDLKFLENNLNTMTKRKILILIDLL